MSMQHDPELEDILQDQELRHVAEILRAGRITDPPLDDAFRSALRRQLMNRAWGMGETSVPWWRRGFGPAGLAWAGAAVGVVLIAAIVVFMANNPTPSDTRQVLVASPLSDQPAVKLQQPILVNFNQPMDHQSTEAAVQITPATTVAFSWQANTLSVQPTSGDLAPNTQYQVTIGPGAKTAAGSAISAPATITFVTQAPPAPSPSPTPVPSPTPRGPLTGQRQLASVPDGISNIQWGPDSSTVYFVTGKGALESVPAVGGAVTVIVADGVTSAALTPAGDRIAYVRNGKIEILTPASATTLEIVPASAPGIVGWAKDGVEWTAADGVHLQGADGLSKVTSLPSSGTITPLSFAPDGAHLAYTQDQSLELIDLVTGKSIALGLAGSKFLGWSPDATGALYSSAQGVVLTDVGGKSTSSVPAGDPSWSSLDEILLGSDTDLYEVRPDGSALTKLGDGTFRLPVWAPNGTAFTYVRGGILQTATAPEPAARASLDAAASVVNDFMQARKAQQADKAAAFLNDNGKKAYSGASGGLNLLVSGDPHFSRFYVLTQAITGSQPDRAQFVVRIVLSHEKLEVSAYEETLTLVRSQGTQQFLVDDATAGPLLTLGKGAEVVSVAIATATVKVTFDSDLKRDTVAAGVIILDSKGKQVGGTPVYGDRTVTFSGLNLKPGATYKLVVLSTVQDVSGNNIAAEYDLTFEGPGAVVHGGGGGQRDKSPSPSLTSPPPSS
jgi:hypothetical protein